LSLDQALAPLPLIAILRGVSPGEVAEIGATLFAAKFRVIEVPLNSPEPFRSIERLAKDFSGDAVVGAGTVLDRDDVRRVERAGGRLIVMPHCDPALIAAAKDAGLWCVPGVATPTEAFAALAAGADALKLFPAEALPPPVVQAWRAVLPRELRLIPVGGITPQSMAAYVAAGAGGFGIGSALYKPGLSAPEVAERANAFAEGWRAARG
jgi:2-dehydro-3-deoxyphosphogalactonate aldolase